jgi:multicomponent Na+:H+ antiporter subunit G
MTDAATVALWVLGSSFAFLAALGVWRMPDVFTRMQASTKASTLGLGCLLLGAALQFGDAASIVRIVAIAAFTLLTTPVSSHLIARASYRADVPLWKGTVVDERRGSPECEPRASAPHSPATIDLPSGRKPPQ